MRRFLSILSALFIFVGCQEASIEVKPELVVDSSEYRLDYRAQEVAIPLRTNQTLEVEVVANWIHHSIADSGDCVELFISENVGKETRSAEVVIKAGDRSHIVTIYQGIKPETMQLTIGHTSLSLDSPTWGGSDIRGVVDWGDGTTEEYSEGISHDYADGELHCAQFTMEGAISFRIERVGEIESVILAL